MRLFHVKRLLPSLLLLLAACGSAIGSGQADQSVSATPLAQPRHWAVFLVAGDDSAPVFDHAVARFQTLLDRPSVSSIHSFTSDPNKAAPADLATIDHLAAAMTAPALAADTGCLVFVTSHGDRSGAYLKLDLDHDQRLSPARLGDLLDATCGQRPTVAIISACHSGVFLDDEAANRIILTAARADRTSFGCGASFDYTYFDSCLLDQWPRSHSFVGLYDAVGLCVREKERQLGLVSSEPQASFGPAVRNLALPN
ncbi:MAG TPA: C13 family peptidase [Dongiaceae bacterium]